MQINFSCFIFKNNHLYTVNICSIQNLLLTFRFQCFSWLTRHEIQKPINMDSSILKCANADLRISLYACVHIKAIP